MEHRIEARKPAVGMGYRLTGDYTTCDYGKAWKCLMAYCGENNASLANMEDTEKHLAGCYHDDFIRLYETAICEYAEDNLGRSAYAEVTRYLRRLKKLGEGALVNKLVDDFKAKYPRHRAMMDELNIL